MDEFILENFFDERIKRLIAREYLQPVIDEIRNKLIEGLESIKETYEETMKDHCQIELMMRDLVKFTPLSNCYSSSYIEPGWDRCRQLLKIYHSLLVHI